MISAGNAVGRLQQGKTGLAPMVGTLARLALAGALSLPGPVMAQATETKTMSAPGEQQLFTQVQEIPEMLAQQRLTSKQIPNPHWRDDGCPACHTGPAAVGAVKLRDSDGTRLCAVCHEAVSPHSYIHPVGMPLPGEMARRSPKSFQESVRRAGGSVTCLVCHDLPVQCLPARARERGRNPMFFRGGPYRDRTELCYRCHDDKAYARLNPHDQIDEQGRRREVRCLVCHRQVPPPTADKPVAEDFNAQGDLTALCTGCHPWIPHPGGSFAFGGKAEPPNHLVAPSANVSRRMQHQVRALDITLPLDPTTGRVYCGTCHNVHARGVLQGAAAHGAESKSRLRTQEMCGACHDK